MISKIHPILLIDPPHREASVKGRDARIVVGTQASGSCLWYGLEVRLHTDTASSHKSLLCGGEKNMLLVYSATFSLCLLSVLFLPLLPSPYTIHVQLCLHRYASWWGLLTIPTTPASRKGEKELGKQHLIVLGTRVLSAPCCQGPLIKPGKTTPALGRADQRYACLVLYPPAYLKSRQITDKKPQRGFNKEKIWNFQWI